MEIKANELIMSKGDIGEGFTGIVKTAKWRNKVVAVKIIRREDNFALELDILRQLNHENILKLLGYNRSQKMLVLEYMKGGSMDGFLKSRASWQSIMNLLNQAVYGMAHMHANRIVHLDLKFENILINENATVAKVCDFGTAKKLSSTTPSLYLSNSKILVGTIFLMAPEIVRGWEGTYESDVWSFGCMMAELVNGYIPFFGMKHGDIFNLLKQDNLTVPLSENSRAPKPIRVIAQRCLNTDISKRPSFVGIGRYLETGAWSVRSNDPHTLANEVRQSRPRRAPPPKKKPKAASRSRSRR